MTDIKELALRYAEAAGVKGFHWDGSLFDFVEPFIAAYLAEQEPVAWITKDGVRCNPLHMFTGPTTLAWEVPLFTAPPLPEPAPQDGTTHPAELPARETPVGAAPISEEVRELVERLRAWYRDGESLTARDAADLIERLAARITSPD